MPRYKIHQIYEDDGVATMAPQQRPIMKSVDGSVTAVLTNDPSEDGNAKVTLNGKNLADFKEAGTADKMMTNLTQMLRQKYPDLKSVAADGIVNGEQVYSSHTNKETGWAIKADKRPVTEPQPMDLTRQFSTQSIPPSQIAGAPPNQTVTQAFSNNQASEEAINRVIKAGINPDGRFNFLERLDINGDGKIGITKGDFLRDVNSRMLSKLDFNGDGKIGLGILQGVVGALAGRAFDKMDLNGDGQLGKGIFQKIADRFADRQSTSMSNTPNGQPPLSQRVDGMQAVAAQTTPIDPQSGNVVKPAEPAIDKTKDPQNYQQRPQAGMSIEI